MALCTQAAPQPNRCSHKSPATTRTCTCDHHPRRRLVLRAGPPAHCSAHALLTPWCVICLSLAHPQAQDSVRGTTTFLNNVTAFPLGLKVVQGGSQANSTASAAPR